MIRLSERELIQYTPDDAYYYLVLGKHYSLMHRWTFDGVSPATGFHLLWGYLIAGLYSLFPHIGLHGIFSILFFLSCALMASSLWFLSTMVAHKFGTFATAAPAAIFLTKFAVNLPNELMEACLVVFFATSVICLLAGRQRRWSMGAACVCGLLGMFSRSDFGLVPAALFAATLILQRARWKIAAAALLGSILGLAILVLHTKLVSGQVMQGSARVKQSWSKVEHNNVYTSLGFALLPLHETALAPSVPIVSQHDARLLLLLVLLGLACSLSRRDDDRDSLMLTLAMVFVLLGYVYLYRFDCVALQPWYYANFLLPFCILLSSVLSIRSLPARVAIAAYLILLAAVGLPQTMLPLWPQQAGLFANADYLNANPIEGTTAAWNAGILGYFSHRPVVNIDGLVNDDAVSYILADKLPAYLRKRGVTLILDEEAQFLNAEYVKRGGYDDGSLTRCEIDKRQIWGSPLMSGRFGEATMMIKVKPTCLPE